MKNVNEYIRELYVRKDSVLYVGGEIFDRIYGISYQKGLMV